MPLATLSGLSHHIRRHTHRIGIICCAAFQPGNRSLTYYNDAVGQFQNPGLLSLRSVKEGTIKAACSKFVRRGKDHGHITGCDNINQPFWYLEGSACIILDNNVSHFVLLVPIISFAPRRSDTMRRVNGPRSHSHALQQQVPLRTRLFACSPIPLPPIPLVHITPNERVAHCPRSRSTQFPVRTCSLSPSLLSILFMPHSE